ncbi:S1C family serine protease [Pontibacillus sp. HMF3514]|uniref:S1C family serine protease n=1 Tax=Pontibacillus sp. HMF3514 TaxID=2692425 RepID=UPI0021020B53|nr:trypsin-like peptidase domain-containing protein [Pontibacillus sp. HMF3514]
MPVNKMWTVHFNTDMNQESVDEDSVYILNEDDQKLEDITLKWVNDSTLKVVNESAYAYNHDYDLYIKDSVRSARNKEIKEEVHFSFTTQEKPETLSTQDIIKNNDPKVVMVETEYAQGSGVIVGEGLILTNEHVIAGMKSGKVTLNNGDTYAVEGIVKAKKDADLALIKTEQPMDVEPVQIGDPDLLTKGDDIVTIGNPMSLQNTASTGMVSGFYNEGVELIQITAPITQGSSGGGLFNEYGELVGITSFVLGDSGNLNFAVSTDELQDWTHLFNDDIDNLETKTTKHPDNVEINFLPYGGVIVNWDEVSDADFYNVYFSYSENGQYSLLQSLEGETRYTDSMYLDIDVEAGETYYYSVVAVKDDVESKLSESAKVVIPEESDSGMQQALLGMTKKEVKTIQEGTLLEEGENKLTYQGVNPYNFEYKRDYIFSDNKLIEMEEIILLPEQDSQEVLSAMKDQFVLLANYLYGEPVEQDNDWDDDATGSFVGAKWSRDSEQMKGSFTFDIGFEEDNEIAIIKTLDEGALTDNAGPELEYAETSSAKTLDLYFNESITFADPSIVLESITATNLNVEGATVEIKDSKITVTLGEGHSFDDNYQANDLSIQSGAIADLSGNSFEVSGATIVDGWVAQVQNVTYIDNKEGGGATPNDIGVEFDDIGEGDESQSPYDITGYYVVVFEDGVTRDQAASMIMDAIQEKDPQLTNPGGALKAILYENKSAGYAKASSGHDGSPKGIWSEQVTFSGSEIGPGNYELYVIPIDHNLNFSISEPASVVVGD